MPFRRRGGRRPIANGTDFGLVAGVWTQDGARQLRMARAVQSGQVFINNYGAGGGVELPFGGVKSSGYGREKGFEALYGFTTLKTVAIRHGEPTVRASAPGARRQLRRAAGAPQLFNFRSLGNAMRVQDKSIT
jgi:delta 1-pyrroline-5-carboxylate dehydrogenase